MIKIKSKFLRMFYEYYNYVKLVSPLSFLALGFDSRRDENHSVIKYNNYSLLWNFIMKIKDKFFVWFFLFYNQRFVDFSDFFRTSNSFITHSYKVHYFLLSPLLLKTIRILNFKKFGTFTLTIFLFSFFKRKKNENNVLSTNVWCNYLKP